MLATVVVSPVSAVTGSSPPAPPIRPCIIWRASGGRLAIICSNCFMVSTSDANSVRPMRVKVFLEWSRMIVAPAAGSMMTLVFWSASDRSLP